MGELRCGFLVGELLPCRRDDDDDDKVEGSTCRGWRAGGAEGGRGGDGKENRKEGGRESHPSEEFSSAVLVGRVVLVVLVLV